MKLPQLSLRDLFWLVALVAMGCGWWVNRSVLLFENDSLREEDARLRMSPRMVIVNTREFAIDEGTKTVTVTFPKDGGVTISETP